MAGPAYSVHGVGLFSGIDGGGSLVPPGIGVGLIGLGLALRLVQEQAKASTGQKPEFAAVVQEAAVCLALLLLSGWVAHNVWATCQYVADAIYPKTKVSALADLLLGLAGRFREYSFSVLDLGATLKDSTVVVVALFSWLLTLLAHWQLEVLQVAVYNVVYAFAPILIGLSMFGFGGRRIWFSALVELSSWSITMAVVYKTIDSAFHAYLSEAQTLSLGDGRFLDVISLLAFMASMPFVVPIVTGRLIGSQALGALAAVSAGGTMVDHLFASGRQVMLGLGGGVRPGAADMSGHTGPVLRSSEQYRPGD